MDQATLKRFMARVEVDENGCWIWQGSTTLGYGKLRVNGKVEYAHRASYEHFVGPIPKDKELDHLCRTRACCYWGHMDVVTHKVNMGRGHWDNPEKTRKPQATVCKKGHRIEGENTRVMSGRLYCRICRLETERRSKGKRSGKASSGL